jgi:hypothetical protein
MRADDLEKRGGNWPPIPKPIPATASATAAPSQAKHMPLMELGALQGFWRSAADERLNVGLLLRQIANDWKFEHLALIGLEQEDDPNDQPAQSD